MRWFLLVLLSGPAAAVSAPSASPAPAAPAFTTLWQVIVSGGWVMIPIGIISLIALALALVFLFTLRRGAVVDDRFVATAETLLRQGDTAGLLSVATRRSDALARIVQRTLDFALKNPKANFRLIREVAETEGTRQASAMYQQITYLADAGTIAPMLGLFGTVIGMIQSFNVLAGDVAASRPMLLAEGVAVALITTAGGLVVGIPALGFYAFFRGRVQTLVAELEAASTQFLALLALHYAEGSPASTPAGADPRRAAPGSIRQQITFDDF